MSAKITQHSLAKKYGVTQQFVSNAIHGKRTSKKAVRIRRDYGILLRDMADSYLIQDK